MSDNSGFIQAQGVVTFGELAPEDNTWTGIGVESVTNNANVVDVILQNGIDSEKTSVLVTPRPTGLPAAPGAPLLRVVYIPGGFRVNLVDPSDLQPAAIAGSFWFAVVQIPRDVQPAPVL